MLREHLDVVEQKIAAACARAGRKPNEVSLIAVGKTKPAVMLQEIYDCGQRDFGENKVQEMMDKHEVLPKDIRWHMIGHLQRNKVKYVVDKAFLIHSVDSARLAKTVSDEAVKRQCQASILIEVNVAGEESKFGVSPEKTLSLIEAVASYPNLHVKGLMTIAPFADNPDESRKVFRKLKQLSVDIAEENMNNVNMNVLSMGMTNDYEVAIEEGATMVRVGTGIFGSRSYTIKK